MNDWKIYTDGSYKPSLNLGGIGIVWIKDDKKVYEYSKKYENTTNNQMELLAIGKALASIKKPINSLTIISDSQYALGCIFNPSWFPKKNVDLINKIKKALIKCQKLVKSPILYIHVKGHGKSNSEHNIYNDLADKLATR